MMNRDQPCGGTNQDCRLLGILLVTVAVMNACAAGPAPVVIYDSPRIAVRVQHDPQSGAGHSHPVSLTPGQIIRALSGMRVSMRDPFGLGGLFQGTEAVPVFSPAEIAVLAPYLVQAFKKATSKDLVTVYSLTADRERGKLITSGGMFVRTGRLYIILANFQTPPSAGPFEGVAYELDYRDEPMQPIARYRFAVGFSPSEARIPNSSVRGEDGYAGYVDEAKQLVIDLPRLLGGTNPSPTTPSPGH